MTSCKIALIQICSHADLVQNLRTCAVLAERACAQGAEFILFPENFSFLGTEEQKRSLAKTIQTESEKFLRETALRLQVAVLGGGYAVPDPASGKVFNQALFINPLQNHEAAYQKIHLFDADLKPEVTFKESACVIAGKQCVTTQLGEWCVGLSVCYDLRFPELYRQLVKEGAEILTVPAAFTVPTGQAHWHTLLRARAIENQCYVLAPAQFGQHSPTRASFGHSLVVDPWGEILAEGGAGEDVVMAELTKERLIEVRKAMPVLQHRCL